MVYLRNELVAKQGNGLWGLALRMQSNGLARRKKGKKKADPVGALFAMLGPARTLQVPYKGEQNKAYSLNIRLLLNDRRDQSRR